MDLTMKIIIRRVVKSFHHDIGIAVSWHNLLGIVLSMRRLWGVGNTMAISEDISHSLQISFFDVGIKIRVGG
jgi:hypothetical protein